MKSTLRCGRGHLPVPPHPPNSNQRPPHPGRSYGCTRSPPPREPGCPSPGAAAFSGSGCPPPPSQPQALSALRQPRKVERGGWSARRPPLGAWGCGTGLLVGWGSAPRRGPQGFRVLASGGLQGSCLARQRARQSLRRFLSFRS